MSLLKLFCFVSLIQQIQEIEIKTDQGFCFKMFHCFSLQFLDLVENVRVHQRDFMHTTATTTTTNVPARRRCTQRLFDIGPESCVLT